MFGSVRFVIIKFCVFVWQASYEFENGSEAVNIAVHPSGDDFVASTTSGDCMYICFSFVFTLLQLLLLH